MNEATPTVSIELARIFRDWAKQCEALARPLPKSILAREMLRQAAELLARLLTEAEGIENARLGHCIALPGKGFPAEAPKRKKMKLGRARMKE